METQKKSPGSPSARHRLLWIFAIGAILLSIIGMFLSSHRARQTQEARLIRELMLIQEAVKQFAAQTGDGGPGAPSILPKKEVEAASSLPIGGQWRIHRIEGGPRHGTTELIIDEPNRSITEMEQVDASFDDGNLASGTFTLRGRNSYSIRLMDRYAEEDEEH
jgi:hypothetical protein